MKKYCLTRLILFKAFFPLVVTGLSALLFLPGINVLAAEMGEACVDCHDQAKTFAITFHGRAWNAMNMETTCQMCHGSTDMHVNDPSLENIISFKDKKQKANDLDQKCLECHQKSSVAEFWNTSAHNRNDISCSSCHTIHSAKSYVDELDVCFNCHREKRGQVNKRSRHPLLERKIKCSDCHDPHGSVASHSMIRAENVNQLCYQCHPDKRGPFVFEHPPVAENCGNCHAPHGSRHAKLLKEKVPNLCQDCHIWSRHPGTPYDANSAFTGRSPSNRFFGRGCLNCHSAIHGSSNIEDHALTR